MIDRSNYTYAKKLKALRVLFKLTQKEAASRLGMKRQQQYSDLENGHLRFTEDLILSICKAFDVRVSDFKKKDVAVSHANTKSAATTASITEAQVNIEKKVTELEVQVRTMQIKIERSNGWSPARKKTINKIFVLV